MSNNNLTGIGLMHLVQNIPEKTRELILKENPLGYEGAY